MTDQPTDVERLAASLVHAKEKMEEAKASLDDAKRAYGLIETEMVEAMATAGETLVKAEGRFVNVRTSHRWSVPKENQDAVVGLLKAHRPEIVKETVHAATLNKLAEEMRTAEAPSDWWADVDGLLSMSSTSAVKVTKTKPKS